MIDGTPYENQSFLWGVRDCYGLACQVYEKEFGIQLTNYARPIDWSADFFNLITDNYARDGWEKISNWRLEDLRPGDCLAISVNSMNPNHIGIYLGENKFLHHFYGNFSRVDTMGSHWLHATCYILRHPKVPDLRPEPTEATIQEILSARYSKVTGDQAAG